MAIFINYTNKSLQFYSNNLEKEQDGKSISKDSKVILENNENLTEDNFSDEKLAEENLENLVDSDAESENNDAETVENFQPMGANIGILPTLEEKIKDKRERYMAYAKRSIEWFNKE